MEIRHGLKEIRAYMDEKEIDKIIVLNSENQFYLTGFKAIIYSRPIFLTIDRESTCYIIPALEEDHAKAEAKVDKLMVYYEHPEMKDCGISPYEHLLKDIGTSAKVIGVEKAYFPFSLYEKLKDFHIVDIGEKIKKMRFVKDEGELDLIRKAGEIVKKAVEKSLSIVSEGKNELEIDAEGNRQIFLEISRIPKATLDIFVMTPTGLERTIKPHIFSSSRKIETSDIGIHSRQVGLNGYRAELERTFFVGKPSDEQKRVFEITNEAQRAALDTIRAGITAKEVDKVAREIIQKNGYGNYAYHRVGHGIGLSTHEEPYIRFDENLVLRENMVFSIEPGIYIKGIGGFRHSDTVIVHKEKSEIVTKYPRKLEDLTF